MIVIFSYWTFYIKLAEKISQAQPHITLRTCVLQDYHRPGATLILIVTLGRRLRPRTSWFTGEIFAHIPANISQLPPWESHICSRVSAKWRNFTVKCDRRAVGRASQQQRLHGNRGRRRCVSRCTCSRCSDMCAAKEERYELHFRAGPKSPEWSKRAFGLARVVRLTARGG